MPPKQLARAVRLYKSYKTDTTEYRLIAEAHGMNTGELNAKIWKVLYHERMRKEAEKKLSR